MFIKNILKKIVPSFVFEMYYRMLPFFGALIYGFPSKKITVIGVTGTNGKSTVVQLITNIFKEAEFKVASISSIRFQIRNKEWKNNLKMTMPGRFKIQRFLRQAVDAGCKYVVLEVTSEGIKLFRHTFIDFDTAVFTNLIKEHIESHGSFENYMKAKGELFKSKRIKTSIVNLDDYSSKYFLQFSAKEKWGYKIREDTQSNRNTNTENGVKIVEAISVKNSNNGTKFKIDDTEFTLNLLGKFNVYNSLAGICVGLSQKISINIIKEALNKTKGISGRMESVVSSPFNVFVDYAHTPDALKKVYDVSLGFKAKSKESKLICVFGSCGGGRDKWKRKELGAIASKYCDKIILANEDPYNDDPIEIITDIEKGIDKGVDYEKIIDRRTAIKKALSVSKSGDVVIITGKGSESLMCVASDKKIKWDDREVVREEMEKL